MSALNGDLSRVTVLVQSTKTRPDGTSESDSLSAKRARLTRTDTQRPGVADEKAEQADKERRRFYNSQSLKRPYASSLEPKAERVEQASGLRKRQIGSDGDDDEHRLIRRSSDAPGHRLDKKVPIPRSLNYDCDLIALAILKPLSSDFCERLDNALRSRELGDAEGLLLLHLLTITWLQDFREDRLRDKDEFTQGHFVEIVESDLLTRSLTVFSVGDCNSSSTACRNG
ncbi:hypothetical protein QBC46DRAFT_339557 [Diplogelasinospora grovesii]|uniref:Uncharacterized protein n=1 Tax=Diplogelasinospora grovesii TaxID=303347 RepID=A0AAN6NAV5_9PEZI|nr:hypothetical protein QBC46DRAFT_339557 [Diplogelasinospora grovesii]